MNDQYDFYREKLFSNPKYLGCFYDDLNNRLLDEYYGRTTLQDCAKKAMEGDYAFIGVQDLQNGTAECWATNNIVRATSKKRVSVDTKDFMKTKCLNWNGSAVGGKGVNALYRIRPYTAPKQPLYHDYGPSSKISNLSNKELQDIIKELHDRSKSTVFHLGCYKDKESDRALPIAKGRTKTWYECGDIARKMNKPYFGLQYRHRNPDAQCWVGSDYKQAVKHGKADNCTTYGVSITGEDFSNALYKIGI